MHVTTHARARWRLLPQRILVPVLAGILVWMATAVVGIATAGAQQQERKPLLAADAHLPLMGATDQIQNSPGAGVDPTQVAVVQVGVQFLNWEKLDTLGGTYRFVGILCVEWNPSKLPDAVRDGSAALKRPVEECVPLKGWEYWQPRLLAVNSLDAIVVGTPSYFMRSNGCVRAEVRVTAASLITRFNFKRIPFDSQALTLLLAPDRESGAPLRLEPLPGHTSVSESASMLEWRVQSVSATPKMGNRLEFSLQVERYWTYYLANIFLPMFVLISISYSTLWIARSYFAGAFSLVAVTIASLFLLKLNVALSDARAVYFTFMDGVASFHLLVASLIAMTDVFIARHFASLPDPKDEGLVYYVRIGFPIFYIVGVVSIVIIFFAFL